MVALAPSVELMFSSRDDVHKALMNTLGVTAMVTGRTPVLPLVPCDSPWLRHRSQTEYNAREMDFSTVGDRSVVQFGPKDDLRCFWKAWSCATCDKITISWYDFQRLLEDAPVYERTPNEGELLFHMPCLFAADLACL
jgi:hypothetical protein